MVKFFKQPEDTLAKAKDALGKAKSQFDAATAHAAQEEAKQLEVVNALALTIAEKRDRATVLSEIAAESARTSDYLSTV